MRACRCRAGFLEAACATGYIFLPLADCIGAVMRQGFRVVLIAVAIAAGFYLLRPTIDRALFAQTEPRAVEARGSLADFETLTVKIFQEAAPSVVQVAGRAAIAGPEMFAEQDESRVQGGTGFVWDRAGHLVTNNHVVQGVDQIQVRFASGEVARAQIVGSAPSYDLAVIRVSNVRDLPSALPVGTSSDLKVGQAAFAIGNPFGLDQSLTSGIISALSRRLPTSGGREIANVIQTDAAINPGNSGGPLLDSAGRLIGVNTAIFSPSGAYAGIGFAIPVDVVNRVVPQLIRAGRVPIPGIGIQAGSDAAASRIGVNGVAVIGTAPGSPAERAGLRPANLRTGQLGDVIVGVNGKPVRRLAELIDLLEQAGVGATVQLDIQRGGSRTSVPVQIADIGGR
jgi:S1-C subfamily serine protease